MNEIYTGKAKEFLLDNFQLNLEEFFCVKYSINTTHCIQAEAFESYVTSPTKIIYLSAEQVGKVKMERKKNFFLFMSHYFL